MQGVGLQFDLLFKYFVAICVDTYGAWKTSNGLDGDLFFTLTIKHQGTSRDRTCSVPEIQRPCAIPNIRREHILN